MRRVCCPRFRLITISREISVQIPNTVGQQQSLQLLNAQMNRIVTQNAKMLEVISAQIGQAAESDARKAVEQNAATV